MPTRSRVRLSRIVRIGIAAAAIGLLVAIPASADGAEVTRGSFHTFAAGVGLGLDVSGHAVMIRTADGRTFVSVHVEGLAPYTTYGSHVHKQACTNGDADGHYQYTPGGPVNDQNEIWPGFTTDAAGNGNGNARNHGIAGSTAVSVVVHAPGGAKIACADLE